MHWNIRQSLIILNRQHVELIATMDDESCLFVEIECTIIIRLDVEFELCPTCPEQRLNHQLQHLFAVTITLCFRTNRERKLILLLRPCYRTICRASRR